MKKQKCHECGCEKLPGDIKRFVISNEEYLFCQQCLQTQGIKNFIDKKRSDGFFSFCQDLYETSGNSTQLDEDFINLLWHKLKDHLPELRRVI
jgi:hypothetical protein